MSRRFWTADELRVLREFYPHRSTKAIAEGLGRSTLSTYQAAAKLGLKKSPAFLKSAESGMLQKGQTRPESIPHQFKPGLVPANKGLRRPGWYAGRMRDTQLKPGQRTGKAAQNWMPIGTIRADSEGFLRIKIRETAHGKEPTGFGNTKAWPLYSRWLWELDHGPIPPKHIVKFKDGNRANCVIENLELLSMADNARRNSMWSNLPRELAEVIQLSGALKRKLRSREDGKKQD